VEYGQQSRILKNSVDKIKMEKFTFLITFLLCQNVYPQGQHGVQRQIDSLKSVRSEYEKKIQQINVLIKNIEDKKVINEFEKYSSIKYLVPDQSTIKIRDQGNSSGEILFTPIKGEEITLIDFNDDLDYWFVTYKSKAGYVNDVFIQQSSSISDFKKYLVVKKAQDAEESKRKDEELKKIKVQKSAEKRALDDQKRDAEAKRLVEEAKILDVEFKKKEEQRRADLIKKYGSTIGGKIIAGKIWIGMTDAMAKESWGYPDDINRTVGSFGVHEQWVYPNDVYLYFEDGILTTFQD
jgi:hypothetical protein